MSKDSNQSSKQSNESPTNDRLAGRLRRFDDTAHNAQILLSMARDRNLQQAAIAELESLAKEIEDWKGEAIAANNEDHANLFLAMSCTTQALIAEINMWLLLKTEEPDKAWDRLIDAQMATQDALRTHPAFDGYVSHLDRLNKIEKLVFPPQVFFSAGLVVGTSVCSICGGEYGNCCHVVGRPYMGELCRRILKDVTADHVSIVTDPANKRCRVTHFMTKDGKRNRMTWKVEPSTRHAEPDDKDGLEAQGIIISASDFES
jgi:hypothetical protein